jgi:hypothetical protein
VQIRLGSSGRADVLLKAPAHHLVHHFEERNKITLASSIRPDHYVQ